MFAKATLFIAASAALFATGAVAQPTDNGISNSCNTGSVQCCNSLQSAHSPTVEPILAVLGISAGSIIGQVGLTCTPVTVVGAGGGAKCAATPVCCKNVDSKSLVGISCSPVNVAL